jgi:hypothetical protein
MYPRKLLGNRSAGLFTWVKKVSIGGDYGVNSIMRIHTIDISS